MNEDELGKRKEEMDPMIGKRGEEWEIEEKRKEGRREKEGR